MATDNMPDQSQALLALQQHTQQMMGKQTAVLGILHDMHFNLGSPQSVMGFINNPIMPKGRGKKETLAEKIFASVREDFKKVNESGKIIYDGPVTNGAPVISGLEGGGGRSGGGMEIG